MNWTSLRLFVATKILNSNSEIIMRDNIQLDPKSEAKI